ncbi:hypothetical protein CCUS01_07428 [Colletotrichum cuscutae]|uniref:Uncharacterized protein n=1 Tax=Colletotrichum cuscutae TaxID=1209917 RepID=A0AAI9XWX0_9PEZI|nr:hypothetical protein CCUS01_07428 [Colletotrichum cuscutae]
MRGQRTSVANQGKGCDLKNAFGGSGNNIVQCYTFPGRNEMTWNYVRNQALYRIVPAKFVAAMISTYWRSTCFNQPRPGFGFECLDISSDHAVLYRMKTTLRVSWLGWLSCVYVFAQGS